MTNSFGDPNRRLSTDVARLRIQHEREARLRAAEIEALQDGAVLLDGRLDAAETDIAALETADVALDARLDLLELMPVYRTTRDTAASITSAAGWTLIGTSSWTEGTNRGGFSFSSGQLTVPVNGLYLVTISGTWAAATGGRRGFGITHGSVSPVPDVGEHAMATGPTTSVNQHRTESFQAEFTASEVMRVTLYQNVQTTLDCTDIKWRVFLLARY